jgi:hypothetical protein
MLSAAGLGRRDILDAATDPIKRIKSAFGARPEGEYRQSAGNVTRPCLTGLKWT